MADSRAMIVDWLRNEFAAEQSAGFPRLNRVPDTRVIAFLDHFATLGPAQQWELTTVLAHWSSYHFLEVPIPSETVEQFTRATTFPGRTPGQGLRYTSVNLLAGLTKEAGDAGLDGWFGKRGVTGLALQPPKSLVGDSGTLTPVRIPGLRRLVKTALTRLFAPNVEDIGSETWLYEGMLAGSSLRVLIRYSGRMGRRQLDYQVAVRSQQRALAAPNLCYESILGVGFGRWDYLTKENADRSVDLLAELVEYVARVPGRLPV